MQTEGVVEAGGSRCAFGDEPNIINDPKTIASNGSPLFWDNAAGIRVVQAGGRFYRRDLSPKMTSRGMPRDIEVAPDTNLLVDQSRSPRTTLGPKKAVYGHCIDCYLLAAAVAAVRYGWFPALKAFDWQVPSSLYESGFPLGVSRCLRFGRA